MNATTGSSSRNLGGTFSQLFALSPALDKESIALVHRIRHDVYCRDLGWEPVRADGMEIDAYDRHSIHCLLRRRDNGDADCRMVRTRACTNALRRGSSLRHRCG